MIDLTKERQLNLLKEISKCRSIDNNCDYLLEHSDCDDLIDYINDLQQENKELKERHYLIQGGRGNCKTLVLMLQKENEKYKSILDEIREYISDNHVSITQLEAGTGLLYTKDYVLQILDKATEQK